MVGHSQQIERSRIELEGVESKYAQGVTERITADAHTARQMVSEATENERLHGERVKTDCTRRRDELVNGIEAHAEAIDEVLASRLKGIVHVKQLLSYVT